MIIKLVADKSAIIPLMIPNNGIMENIYCISSRFTGCDCVTESADLLIVSIQQNNRTLLVIHAGVPCWPFRGIKAAKAK